MKISFVLPGRAISGGNRATVIAANGLIERGHQVRLLVCEPKIFSRSKLRNEWLKIRYRGGVDDWLQLLKGSVEYFRDITKCSFEKDELVVAAGLWSCREISRVTNSNIKKVHYIYGSSKWDINLMKAAWSEDVPKLALATHLEAEVKEICGQKVLAVIPNGIDTSEYYPSVPESERDGIGTVFGCTIPKDPETILSVLRRLRQSRPQVPQRVFGASRRPKEMPRKVYARLATVEKTREIYSRSLVWFLASSSEGFSMPVLEAMDCGCAVVATDCGGPRDTIIDGENGFLVEVGNVKQIVDRIKLLLDDAELRWRFVQKSKETVSRFTWDNTVNKLEKVLYSIAEARQS
ncbi:MAG: glycosyltransferase family 4 protein [Planctomycetota bacterium]|nr:glycosyltransferase family 4 protein [Planctomycetota bacterium]